MAAFEGAKTVNGGEVVKGSGNQSYDGRPIVRVGDVATYPDGSTAVIMAGAGKACESEGVPVALIGSPLSNGDTIVSSPVTALEFHESADEPILVLFDPAYLRGRHAGYSLRTPERRQDKRGRHTHRHGPQHIPS
ncbi:PAAR domain-containing protein [Cupriavidus lacunae]|uniref:PAAR domain-containing protein n=1 Tax=Cupriavidus lacunae TaxID=2666307 RepID=UPI001FCA2094|nr:PAAR domain-containing protein [Cupriavidus lacunae]